MLFGCNNSIDHHAFVGTKCQNLKYKISEPGFLAIGDNNDIREFSLIHRSSKSSDWDVTGDGNLIMGSRYIALDCNIGNSNIFASRTLLASRVVVEDYVHTAGAVVVHHFCHLGSFSFIGDFTRCSEVCDGGGGKIAWFELRRAPSTQIYKLRSRFSMRSLRMAYQRIFMLSKANSIRFEDRLAKLP